MDMHARIGIGVVCLFGGVCVYWDIDGLGYTLDEGCGGWNCADEGGIACFEEVFCFVGVDSGCYRRHDQHETSHCI